MVMAILSKAMSARTLHTNMNKMLQRLLQINKNVDLYNSFKYFDIDTS